MRLLFLLSLVVAPGAYAASGCNDLSGTPIHFGVDWQTQIKPIINETLGGRCTSCHNNGDMAGGLDLSDTNIDAIYKIVGSRVQPGDPIGSMLFIKVNCAVPDQGAQMPFGGNPLSIPQLELIYDWIEQGAYGEDPFDPINRDFIFRDSAESIRR